MLRSRRDGHRSPQLSRDDSHERRKMSERRLESRQPNVRKDPPPDREREREYLAARNRERERERERELRSRDENRMRHPLDRRDGPSERLYPADRDRDRDRRR